MSSNLNKYLTKTQFYNIIKITCKLLKIPILKLICRNTKTFYDKNMSIVRFFVCKLSIRQFLIILFYYAISYRKSCKAINCQI